jgi:ArsR family transcriptional regulator, arsenate/arsenite/antimonite-responsive transcriptional repressor
MELFTAVHQLTALAHETRLAVFRTLVQAGPNGVPAGEIASLHGLAGSSLSFHLNILSNAQLVTATREGRIVRYAPAFAEMNALLAYLLENCCAGAQCAPSKSVSPAKLKRKSK